MEKYIKISLTVLILFAVTLILSLCIMSEVLCIISVSGVVLATVVTLLLMVWDI